MNWGYKIIIVYAVFISGIIFMVIKSSMQDVDLVMPDYYEQELKYQTTIDATNNANALSARLVCEIKNDSLLILFPPEMKNIAVKIDLLLYCVADKRKDIRKSILVNEGIFTLPVPQENKGMHNVKVNWQANGKDYYYEQKLFIQ